MPICQLCLISYAWGLLSKEIRCNMDRPDDVLHLARCELYLGPMVKIWGTHVPRRPCFPWHWFKSFTSCFTPPHQMFSMTLSQKFTSFSDSAIAPMVSFTTLGGQKLISKTNYVQAICFVPLNSKIIENALLWQPGASTRSLDGNEIGLFSFWRTLIERGCVYCQWLARLGCHGKA